MWHLGTIKKSCLRKTWEYYYFIRLINSPYEVNNTKVVVNIGDIHFTYIYYYFSIISPCFGKGKDFSNNSDIQHLHENGNESYVLLMGFILCFETLSCYSTQLFKKCFTCSSVTACILDSRWCNNSCRTYKELGQGYFYYSIRKKIPSILIYLQPTPQKCYHKKKYTYLNLVYSICPRVNIY